MYSTYFLFYIYYLVVSCQIQFGFTLKDEQSIILSPGTNFQEVFIEPGEKIQVKLASLPANTFFSIVQAHAFLSNISISYNSTLLPGLHTNGSDIGLVLFASSSMFYLSNGNDFVVETLLILQTYDINAPIPGNCNMEQSIKTAPFLPTFFNNNLLIVQYPLGSWPLNVHAPTCDKAKLQYDIYHFYLPERDITSKTAFKSFQLFSDVKNIEKYGRKVTFNGNPPSEVLFVNYPGTGRLVVIILRSLTSSAAYVPSLSYGCIPSNSDGDNDNDDYYAENSCEVLSSTGSKILSAFLIFVGLFLTFYGHRFYKCQVFLFGFCLSALLFYVIFLSLVEVTDEVAGTTSTAVGAAGGSFWLTMWSRCGSPLGSVFLSSFVKGILVASIVAYTPLGDVDILKDDATFWVAFFCVVLIVPLILVSFTHITSVVCSAVVGSYIFLVPVDHYVGANLKNIMLNILKRATVGKFRTAVIDPPFQTPDLVLVIIWGALAVVGISFQLWQKRGSSMPFPTNPRDWPPSAEIAFDSQIPDERTRLIDNKVTLMNQAASTRTLAQLQQPAVVLVPSTRYEI